MPYQEDLGKTTSLAGITTSRNSMKLLTRDIMEQNPTDTNVTPHNKAKAEFTKEKLQVQAGKKKLNHSTLKRYQQTVTTD